MGKTIILSVNDGQWNKWGEQFCKRQPQARTQKLISATPSVNEAKKALIDAVTAAGKDGTLVISVGHGGAGSGSTLEGMIDLAPNKVMRLGGANASVPPHFVSVFYDVSLTGPPAISDLDNDTKYNPGSQRLVNWKIYQEIATAFKTTQPYEVVLLSCKVGNAIDFVKKIANDWKVVVRAYTVRVALDSNPPRFKAYLENRPPPWNPASEAIFREEELPYQPADTIRVGPPL